MSVDQMMYFALGFLIATLLALIVLPSVWKRAVRLTKKRMEAATPITMAEFRADKDQLRAEFALVQRRLERNIESLRTRLAEQLSELNAAKSDAAIARTDYERMHAAQSDLEARNAQANARVQDLEREIATLGLQLRTREREMGELLSGRPAPSIPEPLAANTDVPEPAAHNGKAGAIASIRQALSFGEKETFDTLDNISDAYSRISSAGSELSALVKGNDAETRGAMSLAEELSQEDALEKLHRRIADVESIIRSGWENGTADKEDLRNRLGDIASEASSLIYATDSEGANSDTESLFERIRKFAGDSLDAEEVGPMRAEPQKRKPAREAANAPSLADRIAAFESAQTRH